MVIVFEISRPFQKRIWRFKSSLGRAWGWGWFALHVYPMRFDELTERGEFTEVEPKW